MSAKFAKKEKAETSESRARKIVDNDSRLKLMKSSSAKEKKEIAKRQAKKGEAKAKSAAKAEANEGKRAEMAAKKIKVLTKENPKREGSAAFKMFELYSKNKTVGDFLEVGGTSAAIRYDEKAGYIELA